ncbi:MAG TPA: TetR/AcrR family transcriptional regulator [Polyangiaceae bacterium]|jgi:AcrR family transcriptional regulator
MSETRGLLLELARSMVAAEGTADFSLREVARRAGVSPAAVYRHFASKEALLDEVCAIGFQKLCMYLLKATNERTPRARLEASGDAYLRFALENPEDYRAIFMTPDARAGRAKKPGAPAEAFQLLMDRVRECMDARVLARADVRAVSTSIWAHVHGLASLRLSGHLCDVGSDAHFKAFYRESVDRLVSAFEVNAVHKKKGAA